MRISDWSSDVCSSDLIVMVRLVEAEPVTGGLVLELLQVEESSLAEPATRRPGQPRPDAPKRGKSGGPRPGKDPKSGRLGKSVSVRVDLGGRRTINKTRQHHTRRNPIKPSN